MSIKIEPTPPPRRSVVDWLFELIPYGLLVWGFIEAALADHGNYLVATQVWRGFTLILLGSLLIITGHLFRIREAILRPRVVNVEGSLRVTADVTPPPLREYPTEGDPWIPQDTEPSTEPTPTDDQVVSSLDDASVDLNKES